MNCSGLFQDGFSLLACSKTVKYDCRATYREHVEDTFTFDPKTLAILSVTLVAFPTFLYNVMTSEYNKADDKAGR